MIRVTVWQRGGQGPAGIRASGHAGAGPEGHDLVCSAVSALMITGVNALSEIADIAVDVASKDGLVDFVLPQTLSAQQRYAANIILRTIVLGLSDIQRSYPAHLNIQWKEWRESTCFA